MAVATLWIHFRNPFMWDDQAIVISTCAGTLAASFTAILLGISLVFSEETQMGSRIHQPAADAGLRGPAGLFPFLDGQGHGDLPAHQSQVGLTDNGKNRSRKPGSTPHCRPSAIAPSYRVKSRIISGKCCVSRWEEAW